MKKEQAISYKFALGFACMAITFWSCTNEINDMGKDLLLPGDLVKVGKVTDTNIKAFQLADEKQRTDRPANNLLGTLNDPIFGKSTADFAVQFRLGSYPKFKSNDIIDSLVYYFAYQEIYGDILTPQKIRVYELASDLYMEDEKGKIFKYFQDIDLKGLAKSEVLAERYYVPRYKDTLDSKTSTRKIVTQVVAFQLDHSLARYLMQADTTTLGKNELFIKYFKGLYVEAGDVNQGGTIMKILGSGLLLYYRNGTDTLVQSFENNNSAARVNRFTHDYSNTSFAANLDKETVQDSLIYLQTTGGLRAKILIPKLEYWTRLIPNVTSASDTTNLTINKAELIFQVDSTTIDTAKYIPAEQLVLAAITKSKSNQDSIYYPSDYSFSPTYFGGKYNKKDKTYRFNIAKHLQEMIEKKKGRENYGFYLETAFKNSTFRRVVLKGATSKTGIRLEITYSKIK